MRRESRRVLLVLGGAAGVLLLVVTLGPILRETLREDPRYALAVLDIDCPAPPGSDRRGFLEEVQYHGRLPDRIGLLAADLESTLRRAFAAHPWVERVERVETPAAGKVKVLVTFRRPVLAVKIADGIRVVDGHGILLPPGAPPAGLPVYPKNAAAPVNPAGEPWGDPAVEAWARDLAQKSRSAVP